MGTPSAQTANLPSLGQPHPPGSQNGQQQQPSSQWSRWQNPESDKEDRRTIIQNIFNLFSSRPKNQDNVQFRQKLPDFVRRLEEALYRTASTKAEYVDTTTLETRLQNVARRMVSTNPRRSDSERPPTSVPLQNGYLPGEGPSTSYGGTQSGQRFSSGTNLGSSGLPSAQDSSLLPSASAGMPLTSAGNMGMPVAGGNQFMQHSGMPMHSAPNLGNSRMLQGQVGESGMGMGMLGSGQVKTDPGPAGAMGMGGMGSYPMNSGHSNFIRGQNPPGPGPVMSNGAPVMLRSSRDWPPGQTPSVMNTGNNQSAQPQGQRITINGMPPGHLSTNLQSNGPMGMSNQMGMQQQTSSALRLGTGNMVMNNGMIPVPGGHGGSQISSMVPVGGMQQGNHLNQPMQGMVPIGGMGGMGGPSGMSGPSGMGSPGMGGSSMGIGGMPGIPGLPGIGSQSSGGDLGMDPRTQAQLQHVQNKKEYVAKQQRWLLFLRHCAKCTAPEGQCTYGQSCTVAKQLWRHILTCADPNCEYPRCLTSRELLKHHQKCVNQSCPVCTPVKQYVQKQRMVMQKQQQEMLARKEAEARGYGNAHMMQHQGGGGPMMNGMYGMQNGMVQRAAVEEPPAKRFKPGQQAVMQGNHGTSLIEAMNALEIRSHLDTLQQQQGPGSMGAKAPLGSGLPAWSDPQSEPCAACHVCRYTFEPPSIFCTSCSQRIKRNQVYYTTPAKKSEGVKGFWCHSCYSEHRGEIIQMEGMRVRKNELEKRKNDEETEEGWVQCDVCDCWVHQICGLFNKGRNKEETPYICPMCLLAGLKRGERKAIAVRPQAMLEAKDLQRCDLSDFLEARIAKALDEDRNMRAQRKGVPIDQVPAATGLTLRVINNVVKKMDVKSKFYEAFRKDGYPATFEYKQKVIMLFQKQDGVDVCLYCLYMQEYGENCPAPNCRWIYLSYLDSVKYFRPEGVMSAREGVALRTLVYHEVLQGYLTYVKARGYTSMFIWACPPLQGDDYILYCHPSRQKTPRSEHLREWYLRMLRQSQLEGVVTHLSNLWDTFFEGGRDHRIERPSSTHLPYFEGDYWPGEAESLLMNMGEEARVAGKKGSKAGRAAKNTKGKRYGSGPATTDTQLMEKLGDTISGMKADFIVVHLQEPCSFCRTYISDATRWYHPAPPSKATVKAERTFEGISLDIPGQSAKTVTSMSSRFQLCPTCYQAESSAAAGEGGKARGMPSGVHLSDLVPTKTEPIGPTHDEGNPEMQCEFFDTRQAFLSLCQGNHYQFDSMRRAKHSSMMVLYHLHNPDAPAFSCSCNACGMEIEPGQGFRCSVCQDFDMCTNCKHTVGHQHPLIAHARKIDETRTRMTEEERNERNAQLQRTMALLVHASGCADPDCPSTNCSKVKGLFHHAVSCPLKVAGGCQLCRRMWMLLQVHAKQCQNNDCPVPRCRELREMRRRAVARQEDQRRVAYQAMLRNQNGQGGGGGGSSQGGLPSGSQGGGKGSGGGSGSQGKQMGGEVKREIQY
ncbi:probable histone acetyltransferase HAC1 [Coccomyxa sp. Obi]|nr:probable histone acetyltransferase HAC1 [Coccomyxa sp. Obi]